MVICATTVHHSKQADDLQKQTEETKALNAESPQPTDQLEREKVSLLLNKGNNTFNPLLQIYCELTQSYYILLNNTGLVQMITERRSKKANYKALMFEIITKSLWGIFLFFFFYLEQTEVQGKSSSNKVGAYSLYLTVYVVKWSTYSMGTNHIFTGDFRNLRWFRIMWTDTVVIWGAIYCCYGQQELEKLLYNENPQ